MLIKFILHCHLHDLIKTSGAAFCFAGMNVLSHEAFRLLHEWSLLPNPNPWKDHCPVAGRHLPVSENTRFQWHF